jgi:ribonuclease HI
MGQNITYAPRNAIKSQVLADFVAEWTEIQTPPASIKNETWIMYFDGSVMKEGAGVGLVFISPLGVGMEYLVRLHFPASNNAAEYEALINSLRIVFELGIKRLEIRGDSELIMDQVTKDKTGKLYEIWRTNSTTLSCIICCATTTRQTTCSQRPHPVAAQCLGLRE